MIHEINCANARSDFENTGTWLDGIAVVIIKNLLAEGRELTHHVLVTVENYSPLTIHHSHPSLPKP